MEVASIFCFLLLCGATAAGKAEEERGSELRILAVGQPAELPCPAPSAGRGKPKGLEWTFRPSTKTSGGKTTLVKVDSPGRCAPKGATPPPRFTVPACSSVDGNYSLLFTPTWEDGGEYMCKVKGPESEEEIGGTYNVVLLRVTPPHTHSAVEGSSVTLQCKVFKRSDDISVEWSFKNKALKNNKTNRISISPGNQRLTLLNIRPEDGGRYVCRAEDKRKAEASAALTLEVTGSTTVTTTPISDGNEGPHGSRSTQTTSDRHGKRSTQAPSDRHDNRSTQTPPKDSTDLLLVYILVPVALVLLAIVVLVWFLAPGLTRPKAEATRLVEEVTGENGQQRTQGGEEVAYATICLKVTPPVHGDTPQAAETTDTQYATVRI